MQGPRLLEHLLDHLGQECPVVGVNNAGERIAATYADQCVALETGAIKHWIIRPAERYERMASRTLDRLSAGYRKLGYLPAHRKVALIRAGSAAKLHIEFVSKSAETKR